MYELSLIISVDNIELLNLILNRDTFITSMNNILQNPLYLKIEW